MDTRSDQSDDIMANDNIIIVHYPKVWSINGLRVSYTCILILYVYIVYTYYNSQDWPVYLRSKYLDNQKFLIDYVIWQRNTYYWILNLVFSQSKYILFGYFIHKKMIQDIPKQKIVKLSKKIQISLFIILCLIPTNI